MATTPKTAADYVRAYWTQLVFVALLLLTLGGMRAEFGQLKADVQQKTNTIDRLADDVTTMKIEQARQSTDLRYLREAEQRRQAIVGRTTP